MGDYAPEAIQSEEILELTGKLRAEIDHSLDNPRGIEPARITVTMANGEVFTEQVQFALGTPPGLCPLTIASRSLKISFPLTEAG